MHNTRHHNISHGYVSLNLKIQSWTKVLVAVLQYSYFSVISWFPLKQCILFEILLWLSLPPPYTKLKLGENSGYTRPTFFVWWGEGLDLCELENAPETQTCPKTFVHVCSSDSDKISTIYLLVVSYCRLFSLFEQESVTFNSAIMDKKPSYWFIHIAFFVLNANMQKLQFWFLKWWHAVINNEQSITLV